MNSPCDLHLHSTASDGSVDPFDLGQLVAALGLSVVSLTDHDTIQGSREFARGVGDAARVVDGVEVSVQWSGGSFHVLLYGKNLASARAQREFTNLQHQRRLRNEELIDRAQQNGLEITLEEVLVEAGITDQTAKCVGRPHFAAALVAHGYASSVQDAFDRYLGKGKPLYTPKAVLTIDSVVEFAQEAGVVAVVAHPKSLGLDWEELDLFLAKLASKGFVGVEAFYAAYSLEDRATLELLADRNRLIPMGGSDFHGRFKPGLEPGSGFGDLVVPCWVAERLYEFID
ncbi:MAG: PHP domain-containing protein [Ferrimicrobium sp.]